MRARILVASAALALGGCSVLVESGLPSAPALSVGGTVSGLAGSGLVLRNNGGDPVTITGNGPFVFAARLARGAAYSVTVGAQPSGPAQVCTVVHGSGTVGTSSVTDVAVFCSTSTYTVGGTVSGLTGTGLVLRNNGVDPVTIAGNGAFTFPAALSTGAPYAVTVATQPTSPAQTCTVTNGSGTVGSTNVTGVAVVCTGGVVPTYTVGGTVSGLTGTGLVLRNNGVDPITVDANGSFTFPTALTAGAGYAVTVATQPTGPAQTCTVANGTGTIGAASVTNVAVTCGAVSFAVGGTVSGLEGSGLVLRNNGVDPVTVTTTSPSFTFPTRLGPGQPYFVTVGTPPSNPTQTCAVSGGTGTIGSSDVTSVLVTCTTAPAVPSGVTVYPLNGAAVVSWTPVSGATSYRVYYGTTQALTTASAKVTATGAAALVPSLPNGARTFFALSAVNSAGESALSMPRCGIPTTSSTSGPFGLGGTGGLTLYDGLCEDRMDGSLWYNGNTAFGARVSGGVAELSLDSMNLAPYAARGESQNVSLGLPGVAGQVTTLAADVSIPAATRSRTGGATLAAMVRLNYSPPALRLNYPAPSQDALIVDVGLMELDTGLFAVRRVRHCDDGSCSTLSDGGIGFSDPPGLTLVAPGTAGATATHGSVYRVTVSLDPTRKTFSWRIQGGTEFEPAISGTADPSLYLNGTSSWSLLGGPAALAGVGFAGATLQARLVDLSAGGGGSGKLTALFDNVYVGTAGGAPVPWDDFGGVAPNSGPIEFSPARSGVPGARWYFPDGSGSFSMHQELTSLGATVSNGTGIALSRPEGFDRIQADVARPTFTGTSGSSVQVFGRFFNNGTGTQSGNPNGDVFAFTYFSQSGSSAVPSWAIGKCAGSTCLTSTLGTLGDDPGPGVHPMSVRYDRTANDFVFTIGTLTTTVASPEPYGGPARAPILRILTSMNQTGAGSRGTVDTTVNNVFVGTWPGSWATCTALDPSTAPATVTLAVTAASAPVATGGTPVAGTYRLTGMTMYGAGSFGSIPYPEQFLLKIDPATSAFEMVDAVADQGSGASRYAGKGRFGVAGSRIAFVFDCPTAWAIGMSHSATATQLKLYQTSPTDPGTLEQVFTKQ